MNVYQNVYEPKLKYAFIGFIGLSKIKSKFFFASVLPCHLEIFTLPVFSATMNIRQILTSIFPWRDIRGVWAGCSGGCSEYQKGTILIKYKCKDCFAHYEIYTWTLCHSYLHEKQTISIQSLNVVRHTKRGHLLLVLSSICLYGYWRWLINISNNLQGWLCALKMLVKSRWNGCPECFWWFTQHYRFR